MAELANAIAAINARELDAAEMALASSFPPPPELSPEARERLIPFLEYCQVQHVRALPARPTTCAAFAQRQLDLGVPREKISAALSAIEELHSAAAVGNPVATPVVRTVTGCSTVEAPRSWPKDSKLA